MIDKNVFRRYSKIMDTSMQKTVLIIDDDTEFINKLAGKLNAVGLNTLTALTPKERLDYVADKSVDFIVLDFVMPEMDGATIHNLISHDMRRNIPTIILTNFPNAQSVPQDLEVYVKIDTDLDKLVSDIKKRLS